MSRSDVIADVAAKLGTPADLLDSLIRFESGYDPQAKNKLSSARGLIQIIDSSARELGFLNSADAVAQFPDFESQMYHVVYPYLRRKKSLGPLDTEQRLYMAVFYPAYMNVPLDTLFPASVQKVNPGISTPRDYINYVRRKIGVAALASKSIPVLIVALGTGWIVWRLLSKKPLIPRKLILWLKR